MLSKLELKKRLKEYRQKGLIFPMTDDYVFKTIIQDEELKDYTSLLINEVTNRNIKADDIIFVNTEEIKENISDKLNIHDVLIDVNKNKISLEMNNTLDYELRQRNKYHYHSGIYKIINLSYNLGEEKYFEQLNFNNVDTTGTLISKYKMINVDTGSEDIDEKNYVKYKINIAKLYNKYYNGFRDFTRFEKAILIMTINNKKELREISKGDEILMKVVKKLEELSEDPNSENYWDSYFDTEKAMEFGRKQDIEAARKDGYSEGQEVGAKEKAKETARNLLKKNIDINIISEATGLSIEEIKNISIE